MIRNHLVNIEKVKKTNAHKQASRQTNRQNDRNPSRNMNIRQQKLMESDQFLFSFFHGISNDRNRISSWSSSSSFALSPRMFIELTRINDSNFFSISFWYLIVLIWNSNKMRISNSDRIYFSFSMRYRFKVKFSQFDPYVFLFVESVCILKHHNG